MCYVRLSCAYSSKCRVAGSAGSGLFEREGQAVAHLERRMCSLASEVGYVVAVSVSAAGRVLRQVEHSAVERDFGAPAENLTSTRNRRRLLPSVPSNRAVIGASYCS